MQGSARGVWKSGEFPYIVIAMSKDNVIRIAIVASLLAGYLVVAILRSGTAW